MDRGYLVSVDDRLKDASRAGCGGWAVFFILAVAIAIGGVRDCNGPAVPAPSPSASVSSK